MQLTRVNQWNKWMRNGRRPARPPLRFTEVKPMKLKDSVTTSQSLASDVVCIPQMMEMLSCFKQNDFDQSKCASQVKLFQDCYNKYLHDRYEKRSRKDHNVPVPGQTKLSKDQLNFLLSKYPQPK